MKLNNIFIIAAFLMAAVSCDLNPVVDFGADQNTIAVGAEGGERTFNVSANGSWVAMTESPWITISPANGRGSQKCSIKVDSTLTFDQRVGVVRIQSLDDASEKNDFEVVQNGFEYQLTLKESTKELEDYAGYDDRHFEVKIKSNVDYDVVLPEGTSGWLSYTKSDLNLDRGSRPRESVVRFDWQVNSRDIERVAEIQFKPKENVQMAKHDALKVVQKGSVPIPVGTAAGDSLAILSVSRALGMFTEFDTNEKMEYWSNVKLWKDGENKGRVRYVQFFMFKTVEEIPFAIQYLTAAEEIAIYSNANHFLRSLSTGEHITKLTDLKRLTIGAYGLTELHPDFVNLKNLEYLDLSSNCFEEIPEIITKENFPKLRSLVMAACQRYTIYDLSNDKRENIGGFIADDLREKKGMDTFKRLLKWDNLDTLRLSVNYLQGELPDMKNEGLPTWTFEELKDSLATGLTELPVELQNVPKVLPNAKFFAINFNRFTGMLPEWILKHPNLDLWAPYSLVFQQEGKNREGKNAGFDNEPTSLDSYYKLYPNKKYNPNNTSAE